MGTHSYFYYIYSVKIVHWIMSVFVGVFELFCFIFSSVKPNSTCTTDSILIKFSFNFGDLVA